LTFQSESYIINNTHRIGGKEYTRDRNIAREQDSGGEERKGSVQLRQLCAITALPHPSSRGRK